ncbi:MAG: hypothetical protein AAGB24_13970 [Bacteroidota bacterium]
MFKKRKKNTNILLYLGVLLCLFSAQGQSSSGLHFFPDAFGREAYKLIKKDHDDMATLNAVHFATSTVLYGLKDEERDRMYINQTSIDNIKPDVLYFVNTTTRDFFNSKYPIVSPYTIYNANMFKNISIQLRFSKKLSDELLNIRDYLGEKRVATNKELYLSEGERMLLTLIALENVINLSLENVAY